MSKTIPASLSRLGITGLSDNLQPGQEVNFSKAFVSIFRTELEAIFLPPLKGRSSCADKQVPGSSIYQSE